MKKIFFIFILAPFFCFSQTEKKGKEAIEWLTFQEAMKKTEEHPQKILIDVYTEWCGYCKKMDADTYENKDVIKYINKNFYAVKLDAEMKEEVKVKEKTFINPNPTEKRSTHQIAIALLNNKLGYPTTVFLDEKLNMLEPVPGYLKVDHLELYLRFYGENIFKTEKIDSYTEKFTSTFK